MPMHPTNKHLRITYVHEVNNNKTHLSSMSHTLNPLHMHCSISHYNTHCRMAYGHSNMFLGHDWVTPSRIFFLVIRPSFSFLARIYYSNEYTQSQSHLSLAWMVKNRLLLGLRVYIGIFTYGKFSQILFLPWVRDVAHIYNYSKVTLLYSSISLLHSFHGRHDLLPCCRLRIFMSM